MAVLENVLWRGEEIKAVIKFSGDVEYTVYTSSQSGSGNFIKNIQFSLSEGNNRVNPLGIATSNSISMEIYDSEDSLSPANKNSKYYGLVVNGVEIDMFISYDGESYEPYGIYYATSWSGGFDEGYHGLVSLSAEDKLNTIGNQDLPEIEAYSDIEAGDLIYDVMTKLNISTEGFTIDASISRELEYGIVQGGKVRDFLNNICQLLFARVIIDRSGIIRFVPALDVYNTSNELNITSEYTGSFSNKNNSNIDYNRISVKYLEGADRIRAEIFNDSSHTLVNGVNHIRDIQFRYKALSIEQVKVIYEKTEEMDKDTDITMVSYRGYQNGIDLDISLSGGPINECNIVGIGMIVNTVENVYSIDVANATVVGGSTFEFDTKQMMSEAKAKELAEGLKEYVSTISRNVIVSDTALTPRLDIGDKIVIQDTETMYDGEYKVVGLDITMGEDYSLSATLIRV